MRVASSQTANFRRSPNYSQQRDDRWRFLDRSPPRDGATYRALRTGLEPSMPYEDGLAARSHEPACTLSDAIACITKREIR